MPTPTPAIAPPPSAARARLYRLLGGGAIAIVTAGGGALAAHYPAAASYITMIVGPVCAYIAKQVGIPLESIVELALGKMTPEKVASIAVQAMQSLPPDASRTIARQVIESMRPPPPVVLVDPSGHELGSDDGAANMGRQP